MIKALFMRKYVVSEMYDLADRVADLLVTGQNAASRQLCRQAFLTFLLHFPLGKKRLESHLAFLVSNLQYEHALGRIR